MNWPTIKRSKLKPLYRKNQIIGRVAAFVLLLLMPVLYTIYLWIEYWEEDGHFIKDVIKVMIGKWED